MQVGTETKNTNNNLAMIKLSAGEQEYYSHWLIDTYSASNDAELA